VGSREYRLLRGTRQLEDYNVEREERKQLIASKMEAMVTHFASNNQI
jgi:hypothetical protein